MTTKCANWNFGLFHGVGFRMRAATMFEQGGAID
jgi:hypothetical protein